MTQSIRSRNFANYGAVSLPCAIKNSKCGFSAGAIQQDALTTLATRRFHLDALLVAMWQPG